MLNKYLLGFIFFLTYIYAFTGIHSDDFIHITQPYTENFSVLFREIFTNPLLLKGITTALINLSQFTLLKTNFAFYDIFKVSISFLFFYSTFLFFSDYLDKKKSALVSFLILFYPTHDAVNYWIMGEYLLTTLAFIFLSHFLINHQKNIFGFFVGILGAFASYGSLPFNAGLSIIFLVKKEYKKCIVFFAPQLLYIVFYFASSRLLGEKSAIKGSGDFSLIILAKQFLLQIGTGVDALIGPSFLLKVYYSVQNVTWVSASLCIIFIFIFYKFYEPKRTKIDRILILALLCIVVCAFGIFSLTGLYPQIAFNLGNRVTIYGSVVISFLIVVYAMNNKKMATVIFAIFIFAIMGISDHWKEWNKIQLKIIENISNNKDVQAFDRSNQLFVSQYQYSKLGNLSHIEFFAEGIPSHIFKIATKKDYKVSSLNQRFYYDRKQIVDKKYGTVFEVQDAINVYDSYNNTLLKIDKDDINDYISKLPKENRHWVQLLEKDNFIMRIVLKLMPRLEYAL